MREFVKTKHLLKAAVQDNASSLESLKIHFTRRPKKLRCKQKRNKTEKSVLKKKKVKKSTKAHKIWQVPFLSSYEEVLYIVENWGSR